MTDSKDYRIYLESEFRQIHKRLDSTEIQLDRIETQTIKTNGCVSTTISEINELKAQRDKYLETRVSKDMLQDVKNTIELVNKDIKEVKENLIEYNFFRKYPKLGIVVIVVFVLAMLFSVYGTFTTMANSRSLGRVEATEESR